MLLKQQKGVNMEPIIIDKYQIIKEIGRGGMGCVYQVKDIHLDKLWAMKVVCLNPERAKEKESQKMYFEQLEKEANTLKELEHPLLPMIVDLIRIDLGIAIVMEYIEGITMERYIEEQGMIPQRQVVSWGMQLAEVLKYLHNRNPVIIYGDMKPSNIMVKHDGSIKVIDFGTVMEETYIHSNRRLGTYGYAAPELIGKEKRAAGINFYIEDNSIDQRSDIYSLGATLYHMVTGESPSKSSYEMRPIRELNGTLSEGLEKIILRCTKKSPDERYQSSSECIKDLERYKQLELRYKCMKKMLSVLSGGFALGAIIYIGIGLLRSYQEYESEAAINALISVICASITLTLRSICVTYRQKKYFCVRQERNIIRTEKKVIGLWCLMVMVLLNTSFGYAKDTENLQIQVKDSYGRDLLIREGSTYYTTEPLIFTWQREEHMKYEISVGHGIWKEAKENQYLFLGNIYPIQEKCERKALSHSLICTRPQVADGSKVVRINFRARNERLKQCMTRTFRIAIP